MKLLTLFILYFLFIPTVNGQSSYFPPLNSSDWDTISPESLGWCTDQIDNLYDYLDNANTKAFIVLKDGKIVLEKYFDSFTQDSLWYWASAGKTLTAFAVGKAQEEGYLSITDTTANYLGTGWTSCTPQQEEKITILHQLNMTAGMDDLVPNSHCTLPSCLQYLDDAGNRWAYHNATYTLLKDVLENATGLTLNNFVTTRIKQPTGMDGFYLQVGDNYVYFSKPRSMARFGLLIQNSGSWNGSQIMTDQNYFTDMVSPSQNLNQSYGYLWWLNGQPSFMVPYLQTVFNSPLLPNAPNDAIAAIGKNGQLISVSNSEELVFIRMGNSPDDNEVPYLLCDSIWQKLNLIACSVNSIEAQSTAEAIIYPNPASGYINISNITGAFKFKLISGNGKIIVDNTMQNASTVDLPSNIQKGLYFIEIEQNNSRTVKKLIIN